MEEARSVMRSARSRSTHAPTVANTMPPAAIWVDIGRPTAVWTQLMPRSVTSAARCMSACPPSPCTSSPTTSTTSASSVAKLSPGPGCCRDTSAPTPETSLTPAMSAENPLQTDQTWGRTCRHTHLPKILHALVVRSLLLWSLIWISI